MAAMIAKGVALLRAEFGRLVSFGAIGLTSLGLTVGLYAVLSRVIWINGPHTLEYVLVVIVVTWMNYELNRHFTFGRARRSPQTMSRFAVVAIAALALNAVLFWLGHDVAHVKDFYVIIATAFAVAAFTFTSHRLFTFRASV